MIGSLFIIILLIINNVIIRMNIVFLNISDRELGQTHRMAVHKFTEKSAHCGKNLLKLIIVNFKDFIFTNDRELSS